MKVGILTMYYNNVSHGGLLQAYSLYRKIKELGIEVEMISYDYNSSKNGVVKKSIVFIKRKIKKIPYRLLCMKYHDHTDKKYKEYMKMIPHSMYYSKKNIYNVAGRYDVYVVGSDQVWNDRFCDETFFLPFIKGAVIIAYAASVGRDDVDEEFLTSINDKSSHFKFVSVREKNLQEMLSKAGNNKVEFVCDPVFLNSSAFWKNNATRNIIKRKYLLLYTLSSDKNLLYKAYRYAKGFELPVVTVPNVNCNMDKDLSEYGDIQARSVGHSEFLGLILDAEHILTDSFHCLAFSILFNKDFYCFNRGDGSFSMNSRMTSLLEYCKIDNRIIDFDMNCSCFKEIDYERVNERVCQLVKNSSEWLKSAVFFNE